MPDLQVSADVDTLLQSAAFSNFRTSLGLTALATTTPGTGVATALGVNVGSAGAFVTFNGAGGTPSSMVGTNITGTAAGLTAGAASAVAVGGITGLGANVATFLATPSGANLATALTTALPATKGGTGLTALGTGVATALGVNANAGGGLIVLADPGADRIPFWDDSAGAFVFLTVGTGLDLTGTTLTATGAGATAVTAASVAAGAGLLWVSDGADRSAVATDTVSTVNAGTANVDVLKILDAVDQSHGLSFVVSSDLAADKTFTYTGAFNFTMTLTADTSVTFPTSGTLLASGGALGTPASGTLTNCTGLPASGLAAGVLGGNITLGESTGQIILDPTLSADGTWSGIMQSGTAGATLAFGDLIYLAAADSRWELADADAASTSGDVILGMCVLAAAADGDPTNVLLYGKIRADAAFPTLTIGAPAYVGTTAGDIQTAQPSGTDDVIRVVGYALTADVLLFNPAGFYITHT